MRLGVTMDQLPELAHKAVSFRAEQEVTGPVLMSSLAGIEPCCRGLEGRWCDVGRQGGQARRTPRGGRGAKVAREERATGRGRGAVAQRGLDGPRSIDLRRRPWTRSSATIPTMSTSPRPSSPTPIPIYPVDLKKLRRRLGLTQESFAARFGFSLGTLRNWERGRRRSDGPAQILLQVIDREPEAVERALGRTPRAA